MNKMLNTLNNNECFSKLNSIIVMDIIAYGGSAIGILMALSEYEMD